MQRNPYSSQRPNEEEEDWEGYEEEQHSSDEPDERDHTDNTNSRTNHRYNPRRPARRPAPQPAQRNSATVSFFDGASNFEINGGTFTSIGGNSYNGVVPQHTSWTNAARPSAPRSKTTTTFFSNSKGFRINNGAFSSTIGDHYTVTTNNGPRNWRNPSQGPQSSPSSRQPPSASPSSQYYAPNNAVPSGSRGTWARQNSPREDNPPTSRQNMASSSSPALNSRSLAPSFPSPRANYGNALQSQYTLPNDHIFSHSAPPSSNNLVDSEDDERLQDQNEIDMQIDPIATAVASQSTGALPADTGLSNNGTLPESMISANATPPTQIGRTMAADFNVQPTSVPIQQGPIGNREQPVIQSGHSSESNGAPVLGSSATQEPAPVPTSSKVKHGKPWNFINRNDKGKGKEKK